MLTVVFSGKKARSRLWSNGGRRVENQRRQKTGADLGKSWENHGETWQRRIDSGWKKFNGKITIFNGKITIFNGKITIFNGKIHYFYGHFPYVKLPEGIICAAKLIAHDFSYGRTASNSLFLSCLGLPIYYANFEAKAMAQHVSQVSARLTRHKNRS